MCLCILLSGDVMANINEFKEFVKTKPFLLEKVRKGDTTWQKLYESYDLYDCLLIASSI